jgi:hypothetical protein
MRRFSVGKLRAQVLTLPLSLFFVAAGLLGCEAEGPDSPNLVLITVDRLAADRLSCFGGAPDAGGSVCALGQRGTLFAWAASTGRSEASGAATVLTGLSEAEHGIGSDGQGFLADAHTTIAENLSEAGYATAAFVASSRVNRSRRLDQGFDLYDDRLASPSRREGAGSVDLSGSVRSWIDSAPSPWFIWIHADRDAGLVDLDRLLSRLSQTLDGEEGGPGILFLALRGESEPKAIERGSVDQTIGWRTHRVPLIWRPPIREGAPPASVSLHLASLIDVVPTFRDAAHLSRATPDLSEPAANLSTEFPGNREQGLDLGRLSLPPVGDSRPQDRFILLESMTEAGEVGLASARHLYSRRASPLDGTGRPVPTSLLVPLEARFTTLPAHDPLRDPMPRSARLEPGPWRYDVLDEQSPVPRLEFHLARQLDATLDARPGSDLQ